MANEGGYSYLLGPQHAKAYCSGRPKYPSLMIDIIKSYMQQDENAKFEKAIEVGCGNGQATVLLSDHFQQVLGTDISDIQIAETKSQIFPDNISFSVSPAEEMPVNNNSVDLVLAAQAAHFFDMKKFYTEADRVLRSGGCLCLIGFGLLKIRHNDRTKELDEVVTDFKTNKIRRSLGMPMCENLYADVVLPYPHVRKDIKLSDPNMTVARYIKYITGWRRYQEVLQENPGIAADLQSLEDRILEILDVKTTAEETQINTVAPAFVIIGRKP